MNTNFKVIGLTRLGIKPESTAQETDAPFHSAIRAVKNLSAMVYRLSVLPRAFLKLSMIVIAVVQKGLRCLLLCIGKNFIYIVLKQTTLIIPR